MDIRLKEMLGINYPEVNAGLHEDTASYDGSHNDWSNILKTSAILTDSLSFYDDSHTEFYNHSHQMNYPTYEASSVKIKVEPMAEVSEPPDAKYYGEWEKKPIEQWSPQDCLYWVINELQQLDVGQNLPALKIEELSHIDGIALKEFTMDNFRKIFPHHGVELFHSLQKVKANVTMNNVYFDGWREFPSHHQERQQLTDLDRREGISPLLSSTPYHPMEAERGYKSDSSEEEGMSGPPPPPEKRRPGRPRSTRKKKKPEKLGRLWEFIRDLLLNPEYNPSLICWENYDEGTFRFVHSDRVAKLWGDKKENDEMNYEKLSRAMRYYYKSQVLLPVYGKRLVYKFGPTATGWRSERPIFR